MDKTISYSSVSLMQREEEVSEFSGYIGSQIEWSKKTFAEGKRTEGLLKHIAKELDEIRKEPTDLEEWCDVVILGLDGAWRSLEGRNLTDDDLAKTVVDCLKRKQAKNFARSWPKPTSQDVPVEHIRD